MLSLDSYPPVPLSTWKGGTHCFGFSSYEGAARRASRANENIRKTLARVFLFFVQTADGGLGLRPGCGGAALPYKRNSLTLMLFLNSYPLPPPTWEGVIIAKVWSAAYRRGKMWRGVKLCYMSTFQSALNATSLMSFRSFSSTPPVPLSLSEREGVPPHTRPFTFVNGTTTPLKGSGTWQGGHLRALQIICRGDARR